MRPPGPSGSRIALDEAEREALRVARRERKLPRKVVARTLGVTPELFVKWQLGKRYPTSDQLMRWWRAVSAPGGETA